MAAAFGNFQARKDPEIEAVVARLEAEEDEREEAAARSEHPYDDEPYTTLLARLRAWLAEEKDRQAHNRLQMAIDHDFYDHLQWTEDDLATLADRGQAPLVFNRVSLAINWLFGTAMRTKTDWAVKPRERDDEPMAPTKTKMMKFVSDANYAVNCRLLSFKDALKGGLGWIDHGVELDPTRERVRLNYESWRNVWYDSRGRRIDYSDWRYVFREKYVDEDWALAMYPERAALIRASTISSDEPDTTDPDGWNSEDGELATGLGGSADNAFLRSRVTVANAWGATQVQRNRVRLTEAWYRVPKRRLRLWGPIFDGREYDPADETMRKAVEQKVCSVVGNVESEVRYAIWCAKGLLAEGPSPYKHNRFPLVPIFCYRRDRDGAPYGVIRGMRDAQEDYNKRASKALHILSTRGILFEQGAFVDEDEAREEFARPDFFLGYVRGYKVEVKTDITMAQGHLDLMDRDALHMEASSGVTNELVAMQTQAVSGRAIEKRQQQGQLTTTEPFENYRLAIQFSGEITLSMIEQYYTEHRIVRITGAQGRDEFVEINQPQFDAAANDWRFLNDITERQADFIVSEQDFRESVRQAQFDTTMEFLARLPAEVALKFLDLAIELSDLDNKDEWLKRIRGMSGIPDPDEMKTPEGKAAAEERAQKAAMMEQIELRGILAELAGAEAKAQQLVAAGRRAETQAILDRINAIKTALEAGVTVVTVPGVTPAADVLLDGAGFPQGINPPLPAAPVQPAMPQPIAA